MKRLLVTLKDAKYEKRFIEFMESLNINFKIEEYIDENEHAKYLDNIFNKRSKKNNPDIKSKKHL